MKSILFGSIGVLAESSEIQRRAFNEAFKEFGLDWYWNVANYCELLKKPGGLKRLNIFGSHLVDSEILLEIHKTRQTIFDSKIELGLQPRNGIENCINFCKQNNIKIGLITTTTSNMLNSISNSLKDHINFDSFDLITTKENVINEKPDQEVFNFALDKLGIQASEVIAVEDTEVNQSAAMQAGLICYLFAGEYAATQYNINNIKSLENMFSNI